MKWREGGKKSAYTKHHEGDVFPRPLDRSIREHPCSRYVTARLTADNTMIAGPYARTVTSQGAASRSLGVKIPGNSSQCSEEHGGRDRTHFTEGNA